MRNLIYPELSYKIIGYLAEGLLFIISTLTPILILRPLMKIILKQLRELFKPKWGELLMLVPI